MLKKKIKIPSTRLIQTSELTEIDKEKESLTTKVIDCKARLLKFEEKEKQWEKDARLWAENERAFKTKQAEVEGELKEKNKEHEV